MAVVIATEVVNTFLDLGHWPTDWASPYQAMLALKMGLVLWPALPFSIETSGLISEARKAFNVEQVVYAEIALGLGAVALAAV